MRKPKWTNPTEAWCEDGRRREFDDRRQCAEWLGTVLKAADGSRWLIDKHPFGGWAR